MRSNNFKRTEKVLYSYKYFKMQINEDLKTIENILPDAGRSVDFKRPVPSNRNISDTTFEKSIEYDSAKDYISKLNTNIEKTKNYVTKIERVLNYLDGTEKQIVEMKYFNEMKDYEVLIELDMLSSSTYYRLKEEVVNRFSLVLWGQAIDDRLEIK